MFFSTFNSFTATTKVGNEEYTYVFQVCGDADGMKDAGVMQRDKEGKKVLIGNYSLTQAIRGSEYLFVKHMRTTQIQVELVLFNF